MNNINKHLKVECFLNVLLIFYNFIIGKFAVFYVLGVGKSRKKVSDLLLRKYWIILNKEMVEWLKSNLFYCCFFIMIDKFLIKILQICISYYSFDKFLHSNLKLTINIFDIKDITINQITNKLIIKKSVFILFINCMPKTVSNSNFWQSSFKLNLIDEFLFLQVQWYKIVEHTDSFWLKVSYEFTTTFSLLVCWLSCLFKYIV